MGEGGGPRSGKRSAFVIEQGAYHGDFEDKLRVLLNKLRLNVLLCQLLPPLSLVLIWSHSRRISIRSVVFLCNTLLPSAWRHVLVGKPKQLMNRLEVSAPATCEDKNSNCARWARDGECHARVLYMIKYCQRSCNICDSGGSTTPGQCRRIWITSSFPRAINFKLPLQLSPEIWHHRVSRTLAFYSVLRQIWLCYQFSLSHSYTFLFTRLGECAFWTWE